MPLSKQEHERLVEIAQNMADLLEEAKRLVMKGASLNDYIRANSYWIQAIKEALSGNNAACDLAETIRKLNPVVTGELAACWCCTDKVPIEEINKCEFCGMDGFCAKCKTHRTHSDHMWGIK